MLLQLQFKNLHEVSKEGTIFRVINMKTIGLLTKRETKWKNKPSVMVSF